VLPCCATKNRVCHKHALFQSITWTGSRVKQPTVLCPAPFLPRALCFAAFDARLYQHQTAVDVHAARGQLPLPIEPRALLSADAPSIRGLGMPAKVYVLDAAATFVDNTNDCFHAQHAYRRQTETKPKSKQNESAKRPDVKTQGCHYCTPRAVCACEKKL
jgi:hypothetical protein